MSKVRVYEVAKQLGIDEQAALTLLQQQGAAVRNRLSAVDADVADRARRALERAKAPAVVEERIRPTVVRRKPTKVESPVEVAPPPSAPAPMARPSHSVAHSVGGAPEAPVASTKSNGSHASAPSVEAPPPAREQSPVPARPIEARDARREEERPQPTERERLEAPKPEARREEERREEDHAADKAPVAEKAPAERPVAGTPRGDKDKPKADKDKPKADKDKGEKERALDQKAGEKAEKAAAPTEPKAPAVEARAEGTEKAPAAEKAPAHGEEGEADRPAPGVEGSPREAFAREAPVTPAPLGVERAVDRGVEDAAAAPPSTREQAPREPNTIASPTPPAPTRSTAPKTGIETWAGRPGVPMPQPVQSRGPGARGPASGLGAPTMQRRGVQYDPRRDASPPGRPGMGGGPARPGGRPGMGMRGGPQSGPMGARGRFGAGPPSIRRPGIPTTAEMSAHKKVIKIEEKITLAQLAARMSLKATDVMMKLMQMGMSGLNINSALDSDTAKILASEFGWEVSDVAVSEEQAIKEIRGDETKPEEGEPRPPVVTVMGHVDHGKTSLLDYIRKTTVASGEAGGITQHVGAYKVKTPRGEVAFLDTPGHEAFTAMRMRGAQVTDIVILVVAADDGVMPQTREAVNHAKAAKVPIVVAVNKVDKPDADPQRPRRELMEMGLVPEELGGDTMFFDVSAKTGQGIEELLEGLSLQAEVLELRANPNKPASGTVIEALLDRGKGPVARILVRDGTLRVGDIVLAGHAFGKIRAMTDEHGRAVVAAGPATPVEILGLSDVPNAGDTVDVVKDARKAQEIAETRKAKEKRSIMPSTAKVTLEQIAAQAAAADQLELRLIIKADVQGSVEAVGDALQKLTGEKVKVTIVHSAVGAITEGDVNLGAASGAILIGFNVRPAGKAAQLADTEGVEIRLYNIIYNAVDDVKRAMEGLLAPTIIEKFLGRAEVRAIFNITKTGVVAGCMVTDGTIKRGASKARLIREGVMVWEGRISGLRHLKEDRKEVEKGFECGISLDNFSEIKAGDSIECFDIEEVAAKL